MPELQLKKKQLQEMRKFHKPIEQLDLDKHMSKYNRTKKEVETVIQKQRELNANSLKEHVAKLNYKTHLFDMRD